MADLIDTLEEHHRKIVGHLEAIRAAGFRKEVALKELKLVKALIVSHLALEDRSLYQPMAGHPEGREVARQFQDKMAPISRDVLAFFNRYDLDGADLGLEFSKDLGRLLQTLSSRVRQEESKLYPLYRQLGLSGSAR